MSLAKRSIEELIFGEERYRRFTQDSPVMPDVWIDFGKAPAAAHDLLLTPHLESSAAELAQDLRDRLAKIGRADRETEARIAHNESYVVATLDFHTLIGVALPLTEWWTTQVFGQQETRLAEPESLHSADASLIVRSQAERGLGAEALGEELTPDLVWLMRLVGRIEIDLEPRRDPETITDDELIEIGREALVEAGATVRPDVEDRSVVKRATSLWRVDRNRPAATAISKTILSVKADAATRLFELDCSELRWAVIDSGIDATHPAFRKRDADGNLLEHAFEAGPDGAERFRVPGRFTWVQAVDGRAYAWRGSAGGMVVVDLATGTAVPSAVAQALTLLEP